MAIYFDRPANNSQWRTIGNQLVNLDNVRMFEVVGDANESAIYQTDPTPVTATPAAQAAR